jgi:hypothetical protein
MSRLGIIAVLPLRGISYLPSTIIYDLSIISNFNEEE